jgi:hypothetical protein
MADPQSTGDSSSRDREEDQRRREVDLEMQERLRHKIEFLYF